MGRSRKPLCAQAYRGFESLSLCPETLLVLTPETLLVLCQITYDFIERDEEPEIRMKQPEGLIIVPGA